MEVLRSPHFLPSAWKVKGRMERIMSRCLWPEEIYDFEGTGIVTNQGCEGKAGKILKSVLTLISCLA